MDDTSSNNNEGLVFMKVKIVDGFACFTLKEMQEERLRQELKQLLEQ